MPKDKVLALSIIIPVYNEQAYIKDCLESIAAQTVAPDEVIVVDNNSTDDTVKIAQKYKFVRVIKEPKQSLFYAREAGMDAAKGDIIGRIDADTRLDKDWARYVKESFQNPKTQIVTGPLGYHDMPFPHFTRWVESICLHIAMISGYKFVFGANMAIRASAWEKIKSELCNKSFLFEDIDMAIHLKNHGIAPTYVPRVRGMVSARRFSDNPRDFITYIGGHSRTLSYHGRRALGAYFAEAAFLVVYFFIKPLHMVFDPQFRRINFKHHEVAPPARPDPMKTEQN